MSIAHRMKVMRVQARSDAPGEQGLPEPVWTETRTLRCAVYPASGSYRDEAPGFCQRRAILLCTPPEAVTERCRILDGNEIYTVEELIRTDRYAAARCQREERT